MRELDLLSFWKKSLGADVVIVHNDIVGGFKQERARCFSRVHSARAKDNRHKFLSN